MVELNATLFAQIINFLILVVILTYVGYKPITKALNQRKTLIENNMQAAEQDKASAAQLRAEYQQQMASARADAQAVVEKAMKIGEQTKEQILREAREEHAKMLQAAQDEIVRERERALTELRGEVVSLSLLAASKVIGANLDEQTNGRMVQEFVDKLDAQKMGGLKC